METIFATEIFTHYILPFLLVFTIIFAILEKTKLLGEDKKQINAIVGFVVGLLLIAVPYARDVIIKLVPFLAVVAVIILIFLVLYGFFAATKEGLDVGKGIKITGGILVLLAVLGGVLYFTGTWDYLYEKLLESNWSGDVWTNVLFIGIIVAVMIAVLVGKSK